MKRVYNEFKGRVGELVNGIVRRYERGDLIVDLGLTEGLLPHREQVSRENYRQGDRARVLISEVKISTKGPQIILSRTHPGLVASLFQFEVPEIAEGIVELKPLLVKRAVGLRSQLHPMILDVDPVGACVGMRGSRVQNVVSELRGEKIDIVPCHPTLADLSVPHLPPQKLPKFIWITMSRPLRSLFPMTSFSWLLARKDKMSVWRPN